MKLLRKIWGFSLFGVDNRFRHYWLPIVALLIYYAHFFLPSHRFICSANSTNSEYAFTNAIEVLASECGVGINKRIVRDHKVHIFPELVIFSLKAGAKVERIFILWYPSQNQICTFLKFENEDFEKMSKEEKRDRTVAWPLILEDGNDSNTNEIGQFYLRFQSEYGIFFPNFVASKAYKRFEQNVNWHFDHPESDPKTKLRWYIFLLCLVYGMTNMFCCMKKTWSLAASLQSDFTAQGYIAKNPSFLRMLFSIRESDFIKWYIEQTRSSGKKNTHFNTPANDNRQFEAHKDSDDVGNPDDYIKMAISLADSIPEDKKSEYCRLLNKIKQTNSVHRQVKLFDRILLIAQAEVFKDENLEETSNQNEIISPEASTEEHSQVPQLIVDGLLPEEICPIHTKALLAWGILSMGNRRYNVGVRYAQEHSIRRKVGSKLGAGFDMNTYRTCLMWLLNNRVVIVPKKKSTMVLSLNPHVEEATEAGKPLLRATLQFAHEICRVTT